MQRDFLRPRQAKRPLSRQTGSIGQDEGADKAPEAAAAMGITAARLHELKLIDAVLPEPLGGAHRQPETMAATLKAHLLSQLETLKTQSIEQLLATRYERLMSVGRA